MKKVENEYIEIKKNLAKMSKLASTMINGATRALVERDSKLAKEIINMDDQMDQFDTDIDEHCLTILALYEPKAVDLRFVITALRIIVDLERVGDHCQSIAKEAKKINKRPPIKPYVDIPKMAEASALMIHDAITAYFNKDTLLALEVIRRDVEIDNYQNQITRELLTYIAEDMKTAKGVLSLINIARRLERIADHATNIAEMVYFMVTGKIIKHNFPEEDDNE